MGECLSIFLRRFRAAAQPSEREYFLPLHRFHIYIICGFIIINSIAFSQMMVGHRVDFIEEEAESLSVTRDGMYVLPLFLARIAHPNLPLVQHTGFKRWMATHFA